MEFLTWFQHSSCVLPSFSRIQPYNSLHGSNSSQVLLSSPRFKPCNSLHGPNTKLPCYCHLHDSKLCNGVLCGFQRSSPFPAIISAHPRPLSKPCYKCQLANVPVKYYGLHLSVTPTNMMITLWLMIYTKTSCTNLSFLALLATCGLTDQGSQYVSVHETQSFTNQTNTDALLPPFGFDFETGDNTITGSPSKYGYFLS
jgi:hypothetical protein